MNARWSGTPAVLALSSVLLAPAIGLASSTLTVVDNEPVDIDPGEPGPGDNLVFSVRRNATYVMSLAFTTGQPGEIVTHRMDHAGALEFVRRTPVGREPRQVALARKGDYAVVVNTLDDEVVAMRIGQDGVFTETDRAPSGGDAPYDVAVAFGDVVVVANRDSDQVCTLALRKNGTLDAGPCRPTGIDPHVVSVSRNGLVAVGNQTGRSVGFYKVNRKAELVDLGAPVAMSIHGSTPPASMTPRALSWRDAKTLFVALDGPEDDLIRPFTVTKRGVITEGADVAAGAFLTDIEANADGLFAVTVNRNGALPDKDEVRVYRAKKMVLTPDAAIQTEGASPSFKQVGTFPGRKAVDRHVIVSEFQAGYLRALVYDHRR